MLSMPLRTMPQDCRILARSRRQQSPILLRHANLLAAKVPNAREDAQSSGPLAMYHTKITDLVSSPRTLAVWEGEADGSRHFSNSKAGEGIYIHIYMMTRFFALSDVYKEFSNGSFASERYFGGPKS